MCWMTSDPLHHDSFMPPWLQFGHIPSWLTVFDFLARQAVGQGRPSFLTFFSRESSETWFCFFFFLLSIPPPPLTFSRFPPPSLLVLTWLYPSRQPSGFVSIRSNQEQPSYLQSIYNCIRVIPLPRAACADYRRGLVIPAVISLCFQVWWRSRWKGCEAEPRAPSSGAGDGRACQGPGQEIHQETRPRLRVCWAPGGCQTAASVRSETKVAVWWQFGVIFLDRGCAPPWTPVPH